MHLRATLTKGRCGESRPQRQSTFRVGWTRLTCEQERPGFPVGHRSSNAGPILPMSVSDRKQWVVAFGWYCEIDDGAHMPVDEFTGRDLPLRPDRTRPRPVRRYGALLPRFRWTSNDRRSRRRAVPELRFDEIVVLSSGSRHVLRNDRGPGLGRRSHRDPWRGLTMDGLTATIYNYFRQVEMDRPISPKWVAEQLRVLYRVEVDPASIEPVLPLYRRVEFGPNIAHELKRRETHGN